MSEVDLDVLDLKEMVLSNNSFGPSDVAAIRSAISENYGHFGELRDAVDEMEADDALSPAVKTKMGVCQFLLGKFAQSLETLRTADGSAMALFYQARCLFELGRYNDAIAAYEQAQKSGYNEDQCKIGIAEAHRYAGRVEDALGASGQHLRPFRANRRLHVPTSRDGGRGRWTNGRSAWRSTNVRSTRTKIMRGLCSGLRSRTIDWATTRKAWHCTSVPPRRSRRALAC